MKTTAEAMRIHAEAMKKPEVRAEVIRIRTPDVRICNAVGHYSPVDLAVMFDLPVKDIHAILKGCG